MSEPPQPPSPEKTPDKKLSRPPAPSCSTSDMSEDDPGYKSRSRSQSQHRRRQNQRQRQSQASGKAQTGNTPASSNAMTSIREQGEPQQQTQRQQAYQPPQGLPPQQWLKNPDPRDITEVQPFERIKSPGQSMTGPVIYARMLRCEFSGAARCPRSHWNLPS
jgi:hypothetical protein